MHAGVRSSSEQGRRGNHSGRLSLRPACTLAPTAPPRTHTACLSLCTLHCRRNLTQRTTVPNGHTGTSRDLGKS